MIKRILLTFVCIFSTILCFADRITVGNFCYDITPGSSEASLVQNYSNKYSGDVVIPSSFTCQGKEYQVTKIGSYAFNYCPELTSVKIQNGVKEIGDGAFSTNSKLKTITIPNSVEKIGNGVFAGCDILENIVLDEGNKHFVFKDNMLLSYDGKILYHVLTITSGNLVVPDGITEINDGAIKYCRDVTSVSLPNSLTYIGKENFYSLSKLENISIPQNVSYIGEGSFCACSALDVTLEGNNSSYKLENGMLLSKDGSLLLYVSLNSNVVNIPETVTRIGEYASLGNYRISNLVVPDNVESIGGDAFAYCGNLKSITLGSAIKDIEPYTFSRCDNITSFTVRATNPPTTPSYGSFSSKQLKATLVVPKGYLNAYKNSKYDWSKFAKIVEGDAAPAGKPETLKNVVVDGITYNTYADAQTAEICNGYGCSGEVVIPGVIEINGVKYTVTKINDYGFGFTDITSVSLPNTLETLGDGVFVNCEKLKKINIPKSVKSMGGNPFEGCRALTEFTFDVHNQYYRFDNYQLMTADKKKLIAIVGAISEKGEIDLVLDNAIEEIGDYAASHATLGVSTIKLPSSLKGIGASAFERCDDISTIILPASLATMGSNPFAGCENLSDFVVEEGNKNFKAKDGILTSYDGKRIIAFSVTKDITIPSTADAIANGASYRNYNIESTLKSGFV